MRKYVPVTRSAGPCRLSEQQIAKNNPPLTNLYTEIRHQRLGTMYSPRMLCLYLSRHFYLKVIASQFKRPEPTLLFHNVLEVCALAKGNQRYRFQKRRLFICHYMPNAFLKLIRDQECGDTQDTQNAKSKAVLHR